VAVAQYRLVVMVGTGGPDLARGRGHCQQFWGTPEWTGVDLRTLRAYWHRGICILSLYLDAGET
jgi:hypothetical protein